MLKAAGVAILLASMIPLTGVAKDLDMPALGVKITGLPGSAADSIVVKRPNGYQASVDLGHVTALTVERLDVPVAAGAMSDEGYRDTLFKLLPGGAGAHGEPISVAGHDAWLTAQMGQAGPFHIADYTCRFYVVVDAHLYEFIVSASEPAGTGRPAEFDTAITAIPSGVMFEPVRRPASEPPDWPGIPYAKSNPYELHYPARARRLQEEGIVDAQFRVDATGHAQDIKINGASSDLRGTAGKYLASSSFDVPPDWEQRGGPKATLAIEFQFRLSGSGLDCPGAATPRVAGAEVVSLCAQAIARP